MPKICRVKDCNDDATPGKEVGKLPVCIYHYSKMMDGKPLIFKVNGDHRLDRKVRA